MANSFNDQIIDEFRANGGRVGGPFAGARLLLLTTAGRRSGRPHTNPVGPVRGAGGETYLIASAGGAPGNPDWYRNLVAQPQVTIEDGERTYRARAIVLSGAERDRVFAAAVAGDPGWGDYQTRTERVIPVVELREA